MMLVKELINSLNGEIHIDSEVGKGTEVSFYIKEGKPAFHKITQTFTFDETSPITSHPFEIETTDQVTSFYFYFESSPRFIPLMPQF